MDLAGLKFLVVGSGFYGAVMAERIAHELGETVVVVEKRPHIGGNSFSDKDPSTGIEVHRYGTHIFHTSSLAVWTYMNRFGTLNHYRHQVLTKHKGRVFSMPINLGTINAFYGQDFTPQEAQTFLQTEAAKENIREPANLEDKAISLIGRPLYEALIKGYTIKQWEVDPRALPASIIVRLPVRFSYHNAYFDDPWQGVPQEGYGALFKQLLAHPKISVLLNTDYFAIKHHIPSSCLVIYTGPVDKFFQYKYGRLSWRVSEFEQEILDMRDFQGTAVMNYADKDVPFTRIHEFKHLHPEKKSGNIWRAAVIICSAGARLISDRGFSVLNELSGS